ncbi:major facilitator superfamily domain-containing protein 12-like [Oppia nitens]|uniref:major facilitator superfamily domain-containing protein 12-like n=1 Tax=Oppia nitens TaxID=1686743 RepID=UPI0023DBC087|nr:major facilitator superfamily domain-containing protein 12-like [Oppia nitens]
MQNSDEVNERSKNYVNRLTDDSSDGSVRSDETISDSSAKVSHLSWKTKIFFSFGHIYNDLCASIWFSYTLIFFQLQFNGTIASILILLGQVADAVATPFVGFQSDRSNTNSLLCKYGKRKTWHLLGTILVSASFPFIFNKCLNCEDSSQTSKIIYYSVFIVMFQFGWAAVQVGHVSLITDLSPSTNARVSLNAYRQAATVASSILVYLITWFILRQRGSSTLGKKDSDVFTLLAYIVCGIGVVFSILFHIFVKEVDNSCSSGSPNSSLYGSSDDLVDNNTYRKRSDSDSSIKKDSKDIYKSDSNKNDDIFKISGDNPELGTTACNRQYKWSDWLKNINFYKVAYIYMVSRLFVNLTQVYTPLFLQKTLYLPKDSIAIIPFVTYISGFIFSFASKFISAKTGPKILLALGCVFGFGSCFWNNFGSIENDSFKTWQVYGATLLFGIGGTTMLIASLALTSDLIGGNTMSSAFVFGTMSFFDKVLNGSVVVILEQINPNKNMNDDNDDKKHTSILFYQNIVVYVSGATTILTLLGIIPLIKTKHG